MFYKLTPEICFSGVDLILRTTVSGDVPIMPSVRKESYGRKILAELSLDEYIYLTENLEVIEHGGDKNAAAYILARKNSVIKRIVGLVLRNELTQVERDFLLARHISGLNKSEIARKNGASRNYVDRVLLSAEKKLYAYLKYPVMMRFSLICPPESIFDEIKEYL